MSAAASSTLPPRLKPEVDEVSDRKKKLVADFYDEVWAPAAKAHPQWPTSWRELSEDSQRVWCFKLMVARKFVLDDAKAMMNKIIEFRVEFATEDRAYFPPAIRVRGFDMDALAAFYKQEAGPRAPNEFVDKIHKHMNLAYNPAFHKTTKWGHPVLIESYGRANPYLLPARTKQLAPVGKPFTDVVAAYHVHANETALRLTRFQDETWAKPRGSRVFGVVVIVDVDGLTMGHLGSDNLACVKAMFSMDAMVYPEFLHKVLVINVGVLIRLAYSMVKPFLDARTADKISFFAPGEATEQALQEWIDRTDIPPHLGGTCACEGGCLNRPTEAEQEAALAELAAGGGGGDTGLAQLGVPIAAGAVMHREFETKPGDEVAWEWRSEEERTVDFSVHFVPAAPPGSPSKQLVAPEKILSHAGSHVASEPGTVRLTFSNEFSWMRSKYLTLRTVVASKVEDVAVSGAAPAATSA